VDNNSRTISTPFDATTPPWRLAIFRDMELVPPFLRGRDIFVRTLKPIWTDGSHPMSGEATGGAWCYVTNLEQWEGKLARTQVETVQLLDEYAHDVALIRAATWMPQAYPIRSYVGGAP